jgi:hypothetical protein
MTTKSFCRTRPSVLSLVDVVWAPSGSWRLYRQAVCRCCYLTAGLFPSLKSSTGTKLSCGPTSDFFCRWVTVRRTEGIWNVSGVVTATFVVSEMKRFRRLLRHACKLLLVKLFNRFKYGLCFLRSPWGNTAVQILKLVSSFYFLDLGRWRLHVFFCPSFPFIF